MYAMPTKTIAIDSMNVDPSMDNKAYAKEKIPAAPLNFGNR